MAGRQLHRLSALRVAKAVTHGHYADGGGLYLQIADSGARSWVFRFKLGGRVREMGLGPVSRVSLAEARKQAANYREWSGIGSIRSDPRAANSRVIDDAPCHD